MRIVKIKLGFVKILLPSLQSIYWLFVTNKQTEKQTNTQIVRIGSKIQFAFLDNDASIMVGLAVYELVLSHITLDSCS